MDHTCDDCGEINWYNCQPTTPPKPSLEAKIKDKIISLQNELIQHAYEGETRLNEQDVIRYSAMVEVLKAMLQ